MEHCRNFNKTVHVLGGGGNVGKALADCNSQDVLFRYWYKTDEDVLFHTKFYKQDCANIDFLNDSVEPDDVILDLRNIPISRRLDIEKYLTKCRSLVNSFPHNFIIFCSSIASSGLVGSEARKPCTMYGYAKLALEKEFKGHNRVKILRLGNVYSSVSPYIAIISHLNLLGRIEAELIKSKQIVTTPRMIFKNITNTEVGACDCFQELNFIDLCSEFDIEINCIQSENPIYDKCSLEFLEMESVYYNAGVFGVFCLFLFRTWSRQRYVSQKYYFMIFSCNDFLRAILNLLRGCKRIFFSTDLKAGVGDSISNFNFLYSGIRK